MDNQHRQIKGYRELSQEEIDLVNEIKAKGADLEALLIKVRQFNAEHVAAHAEHYRWESIAKTHFQQGLMALTRAVTKPDFF